MIVQRQRKEKVRPCPVSGLSRPQAMVEPLTVFRGSMNLLPGSTGSSDNFTRLTPASLGLITAMMARSATS